MKTPHQDTIDQYSSSEYDAEAMLIDDRNRNFSPERAEDYRHENIVITSLINGQFSQAKRQCSSYGLDYAEMRQAAGLNPFPA